VHECVVGACPSRGNQAIALGFDIGRRVAGVHHGRCASFLEAHGCVPSCISLFFAKNTPHAAAGAVAQRKTRRGMPPGLPWRSFGEYALLEDSRYTSQAEN
jgi:hypothetical protein